MSFDAKEIYTERFNIVTTQSILDNKKETLSKFVTALRDASMWIKSNPLGTIDVVSQRIQMRSQELERIWNRFEFPGRVDDGLVPALLEVEQWSAINSKRPRRDSTLLQKLISPVL